MYLVGSFSSALKEIQFHVLLQIMASAFSPLLLRYFRYFRDASFDWACGTTYVATTVPRHIEKITWFCSNIFCFRSKLIWLCSEIKEFSSCYNFSYFSIWYLWQYGLHHRFPYLNSSSDVYISTVFQFISNICKVFVICLILALRDSLFEPIYPTM